jgi:hypothetical protein
MSTDHLLQLQGEVLSLVRVRGSRPDGDTRMQLP